MADGDGGEPGSGWSSRRPELYRGRPLNSTPLATALPAPYPVFNIMGGSSLPLPSEKQAGGSGESAVPRHPHPGFWHPVPPIAATSPSFPFPVSIPAVYFTHPPPMPPMGFPSLMRMEPPRTSGAEGLRSPAMAGVLAMPTFRGHHPHPRSNSPSGMNEAGQLPPAAVLQRLDTSIPMPSPSTCDQNVQNVVDKSEPEREQRRLPTPVNKKAVLPVAPVAPSVSPPTNLVSSDSCINFTEPPPVPESFPRDPVPQGGRGEGWPYAPQGWPSPDDKWGWRVGKRASASSLWIDRYITVPVSLLKGKKAASKIEFASRKSLVEFLRQEFPQMKDPYSIFKAFDWKVPAPKNFEAPEKPERRGPSAKREKPSPTDGEENEQKLKKQCQAGNPNCLLSKTKESESESLGMLVCQICCSEPGFCRECKCILCCKCFGPDADDFSIIRCLNSPTSGQGTCGHAAHLECALASQLAGVIKKNGLDMEYMCRRCDRKTDLKETVIRLVELLSNTATQSKVESSLQLALRIVQDPEEEARSSGKIQAIQATLIGALKKVQEGTDVAESYKELTAQLHELRSGQGVPDSQVSHQVPNWSRAMEWEREMEDSLHLSDIILDKAVPQPDSVGLPDGKVDSMIGDQGFSESDGVVTASCTMVEPDLDIDKELPSESLQDSPKPEDHVLSSTTSQTPSEPLSCAPVLTSLLDQSVGEPATFSIEEHIRQCEAMANRVKGAGQLNTSSSILSVSLPGTLEVVLNSDLKPPSLTADSLTVELHESQAAIPEAEASHKRASPCAEEPVASIPSSSRTQSPCLFNSHDADEEHFANTEIIEAFEHGEVEEVCAITDKRAKRATEDSNKTIEGAGGGYTASTKIIVASKSPRMKPRTRSSSGAKSPSLTNSQDHAEEDDVVITHIIEPPTVPSFDPALETAHAAGLEAEFQDQISEALEKLKRAQAAEYARAEESLHAQKKIVIEQYRELESVCGQFAEKENVKVFTPQIKNNHRGKPRAEFDRAMHRLMAQYGKAQEGQKVFESMLAISNGFGQVSKEILLEHFKWPPADITET